MQRPNLVLFHRHELTHNELAAPPRRRNVTAMICPSSIRDKRTATAAVFGLVLPILGLPLFVAGAALAESPPPKTELKTDALTAGKSQALDGLKAHDQELEATREQQKKSMETEAALKREIEQIGADRRKLAQDLIDTAARLRTAEAAVEATQVRLKPLDDNERNIRASLDGRRTVIAEVLAALQRIGHRPPPALIASPEDALQAVRTAMVLGAVLPEMRNKVDALANDLANLLNVRKSIAAERDRLNNEIASLDGERTRMAALVDERQKQQTEREQARKSVV